MPSVPITPQGVGTTAAASMPRASDRAWASHQAVEVLPLVPVTAMTSSWADGARWKAAAIGPVAALSPT